jgi:hypothetical protein
VGCPEASFEQHLYPATITREPEKQLARCNVRYDRPRGAKPFAMQVLTMHLNGAFSITSYYILLFETRE